MAEHELLGAFQGARGAKLEPALRFVLSMPAMFGGAASFALDYNSSASLLVATTRIEALSAAARWRFDFWCAQTGGRVVVPGELRESPYRCAYAESDVTLRRLSAERLVDGVKRIASTAGALGEGRGLPAGRPVVDTVVGGTGARVTIDGSALSLFIPGVHAPPTGDRFTVRVALGDKETVLLRGEVIDVVRSADEHRQAGYTFAVKEPRPEVLAKLTLLDRREEEVAVVGERRAHPRVPVVAPVLVHAPRPAEEAAGGAAARPRPRPLPGRRAAPSTIVKVEYETGQEFTTDYVTNLSKGGAFVRTASPAPMDTEVLLEIALPGGPSATVSGIVVHVGNGGMGIQFERDAAAESILDAALVRLSAPPKRVVVVGDGDGDDDDLAMAFSRRGFVVSMTTGADACLRLLADDPFDVELLIVTLASAQEAARLVRLVRFGAGAELTIVGVRGVDTHDGREDAQGVDVFVDASVGAEKIADAAIAPRVRSGVALSRSG